MSANKESGPKAEKASKTPIGAWLKAARMRRNTTQAELARVLNTEQSMLAMIENGDASPSQALRTKIRAWIRDGGRPSPAPKRGPYHT